MKLNDKTLSAIDGLVVAGITALVAFGALGGDQAEAIQGVVLSAIAFGATVGIRSALPPRK